MSALQHEEGPASDFPIETGPAHSTNHGRERKADSGKSTAFERAFDSPLAGALAIADGLDAAIIPLVASREKKPAITGWKTAATTDRDQVSDWAELFPGCNFGVATEAAGLVVLDEDTPGDLAAWAASEGIVLPETFAVATGREGGGTHFWFRTRDLFKSSSPMKRAKYDVDVKARGSFVVAPGSVHKSGAVYRVVNDAPIADLPEALAVHLRRPDERMYEAEPPAEPLSDLWDQEYLDAALQGLQSDCVDAARAPLGEEPRWEPTVMHVAYRLVELSNAAPTALPRDEALAFLMEHAPTDADFDVADVERKFAHAADEKGYTGGRDQAEASGAGATAGKKPGRPSAAQKMVQLAQARYRLILGPDRDLWASRLSDDGQPTPHVLWEEDGSFAEDLRLTHDLDDGKAIASTSAVNDAVAHLRALTRRRGAVERIYRRVARVGDDAFYNLGDRRRVVHIEPGAWSIRDELPAGLNFRLSSTMAEQVAPAPAGTGAIEPLWDHLNVPEEDRPLVLAWLVHALLDSDAPHAALLLLGSQGAGKSTATRRLTDLVDPTSAHPTRKSSDERAWVIRAMSNWVLVVDNLSHMSAEFSDLLATTATGATVTYRKLYTNGQMVTATLLNPMILNGITVDGMRPDLRDRTVAIQLDRITEDRRRDAAALERRWTRDRPVVLGGLLDLAAKVLERDVLGLIDTSATGMARMTGYARALLAVDSLLGTDGYSVFLGHGHAAAAEAVSADPLLDALIRVVEQPRVASAKDLLDLAKKDPDLPEHLIGDRRPITPRTMANAVRRGAAALEELGWTVHDKAPKGKDGLTLWTLVPPSQAGDDQ